MPDFPTWFHALWGHDPFPWQTMLAEQVAAGRWPQALDLPTASGKTACIEIALYGLAAQADRPTAERTAPRRIWFVVDRRIVVDEAFARAERIAIRLGQVSAGPLAVVADRLRHVSGTERPLAIARLRGGVFRDDGWARLPSQPAVITSTVDQLGSRLMFRGYGRSLLTAPIFAGLATNDSLILLDEAHCSVPFLQTLQAVEQFRGPRWAEVPVPTPFACVVLSATPPRGVPTTAVFPGGRRERALDHPVLHQRLRASKRAILVEVKAGRGGAADALVVEAADRGLAYLEQHKRRVAVMVNRVGTARQVVVALRERLTQEVDVVLLTGRLRPFERDRLVERWSPFLRAQAPENPPRPVILVSTQCLEVGADFSFDALVTEVASLDALRQRFGRLDRLGEAGVSDATIIARDRDVRGDAEPDPIYGTALASTWKLLQGWATRGIVDFGVEPLRSAVDELDDLSPYVAPAPDAPVLLPAHLDLLCQTSPRPKPEPEVPLYLHGKDRSAPEAQVVWRADLPVGDTRQWVETVALCPPVGGEMLSVPLYLLRAYLMNQRGEDAGDVEGVPETALESETRSRPFLLWRGRDRSRVSRDPYEIAPNEVVVVPASYGIEPLGQSTVEAGLGAEAVDLWERALEPAGRPATVRLTRAVLAPWLSCPPLAELVRLVEAADRDRDELAEVVEQVLEYRPIVEDAALPPPAWWCALLRAAWPGRMEEHPAGGVVLFARAVGARRQVEPDLFADDEDLTSMAGAEVTLDAHADLVERTAASIARLCLPGEYHAIIQRAARWHDIGKLDERFQILLHQGDELAALAAPAPLAKSPSSPMSPARRRTIREACALPVDFRHEMLSLQIAERFAVASDDEGAADLFLHLIASHHGHARPFAPVSSDDRAPAIEAHWDGTRIALSAADRVALPPAHRLDSGVADRFWRLVRRHGWWGLAYFEAILRLSDWYASGLGTSELRGEREVSADVSAQGSEAGVVELSGLDGANPLGFLAALGTLVTLHAVGERRARLCWRWRGAWTAVVDGVSVTNPERFSEVVARGLEGRNIPSEAEARRTAAEQRMGSAKKAVNDRLGAIRRRGLKGAARRDAITAEVTPLQDVYREARAAWLGALAAAVPRSELALGSRIDCTPEEYRQLADTLLAAVGPADRDALDLLAAFGTDACVNVRTGSVEPTPFQLITGSGHQFFLETVRDLLGKVTVDRVRSALFEPWTYLDEGLSMRWDPVEDRRYALMDRDPTASGNKLTTVWMANLLGYRALALFPSVASKGRLRAVGWMIFDDALVFTWPLWLYPVSPGTVRSLLTLPELALSHPDRDALRARGLAGVFRVRRIRFPPTGPNYKLNFSPSRAI